MAVSFVVVPQWQGSSSARAMRLAEGAAAIRADLPQASTREVAVPLEAGDAQETGVQRFSSLQLVRERLADALGELDRPAVVIGGDCGVATAAVEHAASLASDAEEPLAVVWFDARPCLETPASSPSGAFAGMTLRDLLDRGVVEAPRVVIAGARAWSAEEERVAAERGLRTLDVDALAVPRSLVDAVVGTGARRVYLHIGLDVLDPAELAGLDDPEPFGTSGGALVAAIRAILAELPLAGATLTAYAPGSPDQVVDDAPTILRIIAALSS